MKKFNKKLFLYLGPAIFILAVFFISYFRALDRFELVTLDFRYVLRLTLPQKINPDIAIIEIGEDTLQPLGRWPLPRDYHANLIDALTEYKARMIIFDILFCEPTGWDGLFADSARKAGNVYFPFAFRLKEKHARGPIEADAIDAPILKGLEDSAKATGHVNKLADPDGKVRKAPLFVRFNERLYPSMAFKAACDYLNINTDEAHIPVDEEGAVFLNFSGRWASAFQHYSYLDILSSYQDISEGKTPRIDLNRLKGKVCFVGLTATGTQEIGPVPVEKAYPMLGVHVNLFNMLTEGVYPRRANRLGNLIILFVLSLSLFLLISRLRPYKAFFAAFGFILSFFIAAVLLFMFKGIWLDAVSPLGALFGVYLAVTLTRYVSSVMEREKIQKELAVATSIQRCFLPAEIPSIAGLDIAAQMKTAKEVGGDLYDLVRLGEDRLGVMIGDVSGKGVPAALFMARVETLFRVYAKNEGSPSRVISGLNEEVACDERSGLFTTLVYAIFDVKNRELVFSDAGHLPLMLVSSGKIENVASEDGMAVGIMQGTTFSEKKTALAKGDIAVFYTDGITEARDLDANEFGVERLAGVVGRARHLAAAELVKVVLAEIGRFQGKAAQHDDMTIIAVKID